MTLTIQLPDLVQRHLTERAIQDGKSAESLASQIIAQAVVPESEKTFAEILAPIREEFAASGITEAEWDEMIDEARTEVWEMKHGKHS